MMKKLNNSGTTMVEVLAGFVILTIILAECVVHMINVSGNMVMKSTDILNEQSEVNQNMYKKNAKYVYVCGTEDGGDTDNALTIELRLDPEKTDLLYNGASEVSIPLKEARLRRLDCEKEGLSIFRLDYEGGGAP